VSAGPPTEVIMRRLLPRVAVPALAVLALAGCGSSNSTTSSSSSTSAAPTPIAVDSAIAAKVPAAIKSKGTLTVATEAQYAPNEFIAPDGHTIIGMDADLMKGIASLMGLKVKLIDSNFETIIPGLASGRYDLGVSSFTDTKEREKTVDFVTYFTAGTQWAEPAGKTVDPNNACGLRVAVQATTVQDTDDIPARSKKCTEAGKPAIKKLKFDRQDDATNALVLAKADAMAADSPVTAYAVKVSDGKIALAGSIYDAAPYGWPIAKGSPLVQAVQKAAQLLMDNGSYDQICKRWGVESGEIKTAAVNGALS
jgi:polar amino acid transport system substrate-binding protein